MTTYWLGGSLLAAACVAGPAAAREPVSVLMAEDPRARAAQEALGYSDAVVAGDMIYLSGVVGAPRDGEKELDPAFERVFERIATTLARVGASWDDVVDVTSYHTDMAAQIDAFTRVKQRYVKAPFPAWTAVGTPRLYGDTAVVEVKVVARKAR